VCPESIPGNVKIALPVTQFKERCRDECIRAYFTCPPDISFQEKYMSVMGSPATVSATGTEKSDVPENFCQFPCRVLVQKGKFSLITGIFPFRKRIAHGDTFLYTWK
jgi:hypothetical protein